MHDSTRSVAAQLLAQAARGSPPAAGPRLVVVAGPDAGRCLPIADGDTVGRGSSAQVPLRDAAASRRHFRVERRGALLEIVDLCSKNGVELNGVRVRTRAALRSGDRVRVGATVLEAAGIAALPPAAAPGESGEDGLRGGGAGARWRLARAGAAFLALGGAALAAAAL